MADTTKTGLVSLVGAGPGDPGLLTIKGLRALERADVVVYDRLIGAELLRHCAPGAERVFVGKEAARHALPQDEINELLVARALAGKQVCRLKGGDPFVFGRGGEEALYCRAHGVPFEIVPGVSSAIAAPAYAGIPVTQREVATSFAVVTGHTKDDDAPPPELPVADTLVFLMGVRALPKIVAQLLQRGDSPEKPVALVRWGTTGKQQVVAGTLATIEAEVEAAGLLPPALIVVGDVVNLRPELQWFDSRPLWGQTVVVTRAREQASGLIEHLHGLGAAVIECPAIRIEEPENFEVIDDAITNLDDFEWVVFTSTNGVAAFRSRLAQAGLDARALGGRQVAAIGPATAEALHRFGINADFVPESSISEAVAHGLIREGAANSKVLLVRAEAGREVLETLLTDAGAEVTAAACYRTVPDDAHAEQVREALARGEIDWITFSSSSTVRNFIEIIGEDAVHAARATFRVACIGPITAETAGARGLAPDIVADSASVAALADAIELFVTSNEI